MSVASLRKSRLSVGPENISTRANCGLYSNVFNLLRFHLTETPQTHIAAAAKEKRETVRRTASSLESHKRELDLQLQLQKGAVGKAAHEQEKILGEKQEQVRGSVINVRVLSYSFIKWNQQLALKL